MYSAPVSKALSLPQPTHLDIIHFQNLLLICSLSLGFPMIKRRLHLLPPIFHLLTRPVIFPLHLLQITISRIPFLLQLDVKIHMSFPQLIILPGDLLQGLRKLNDQIVGEPISLCRMRFHRRQLCTPRCQRCSLQRPRCQGGIIANAQWADLFGFAIGVFLAEGGEFRGIFLFDCAAFAVELLDFV